MCTFDVFIYKYAFYSVYFYLHTRIYLYKEYVISIYVMYIIYTKCIIFKHTKNNLPDLLDAKCPKQQLFGYNLDVIFHKLHSH